MEYWNFQIDPLYVQAGFKLVEKSNFTIRTFSKNIPSPTRDTQTPKIKRTSKLTHFGTLSLSAIKFSCT